MRYITEIATSIDEAALAQCIEDSFESFKANWPWGPMVDNHCTLNGITRDDLNIDDFLKQKMSRIIESVIDPATQEENRILFAFKDTETDSIVGYYVGFKEVENNALKVGTVILKNGVNGLNTWLQTYWDDIISDPTTSSAAQVGLGRMYTVVHTRELQDWFLVSNADKGFTKAEDWAITEETFSNAAVTIRYPWGWD